MKEYTKMFEYSDADGISITEALGISNEREEQLKELIPQIVEENSRVSQTLEALWNEANHPNEFAWMVFIYGANTGVHTAKKIGSFDDLLKKFLKDLGDE